MKFPTENQFINIHSHRKSFSNEEWVLRNAFHFPICYARCKYAVSVGIHPWHVNLNAGSFSVRNLKKHESIWAIGEIGLDRRCAVPFKEQLQIFEKQLIDAQELKLPVVIHCVKAYSDLIPFMKKYQLKWILHGFNLKSETFIHQLLHFNCYFSLGTEVFKTNYFGLLPLERILTETDNENISIASIYEQISVQYNLPIDKLKKIIFKNFKQIFER